ncbi:MAG: Flp pilus assembly protein CpaB [Anaerolineae bacterium]
MSRRGCIWFAAGLVLALMAGILIFMTMRRVAEAPKQVTEPPRIEVLVAARDIPLHTVLTEADLAIIKAPPEIVPPDAMTELLPGADGQTDLQRAIGQMTTTDIAKGEFILRQRLLMPDYVGPRIALVMASDQVVMAFPAADLLGSLGMLKPGDRVDMNVTFDLSKARADIAPGLQTFTLLQDLQIAGIVYAGEPNTAATRGAGASQASEIAAIRGEPRAILLAVPRQESLLIKYFRDQGASIDLVLRSPAVVGQVFDLVPIDADYILERLKLRWRLAE